ncbi:MAG: glycoside hydrolase family 127 protein [Muribaculaceae bacterium]
MKNVNTTKLLTTIFLLSCSSHFTINGQSGKVNFVGIENVKINDSFWSPKLKTWNDVTVNDVLNKFEGKHVLEQGNHNAFCNFDQVARGDRGTNGHVGAPWFDGLIYESIRGIADYLVQFPNKEMEAKIDGYIDRIEAAQKSEESGYIETYTLLNEPTHRWGENGGFLRFQHDVYNAGLLIDAGVHYYKATGKTKLLTIATRFANYMTQHIGQEPKKNIVPAHSGPEEAVIKLYWLFKEQPALKKVLDVPVAENDYLNLVTFWIENRGNHCGFPLWLSWGNDKSEKWIKDAKYKDAKFGTHSRPTWGDYAQDSIPVFEQKEIVGHAVRATLLATGIATLALETHSPKYIETAERLWNNMTGRRMFITGGVGAVHEDEKFGPDYFLPSDAYLETCAAIGSGFFNQRMNELTGQGKYIDELERVLYNSLLTAVSLSGNNYTYQNPLNAEKHNRWEWHGCPCCPPMFLKITAALPGYIYSHTDNQIYINLFIGSETSINLSNNNVNIRQETSYPWKGNIKIAVNPAKEGKFTVKVRIPGWAQGIENPYGLYRSNISSQTQLSINGKNIPIKITDGYVELYQNWKKGDSIELNLPMQPRIITADPNVKELTNSVAVASGPIIYCFEDVDNPNFKDIHINTQIPLKISYNPNILNGVNVIESKGKSPIKAIPYYSIANRKKDSSHKVWITKQ